MAPDGSFQPNRDRIGPLCARWPKQLASTFALDMVARQVKQFEWRLVAGVAAMPQVFAQTWLDIVLIGERDELQQFDHAGRGDSGDGLQPVSYTHLDV